ncbi:hypothetical protein GLAREA_09765 [Glarea lozoyensis ATCC 20868]|uniref:Uncharacterized protein n=1 Tax=Glarea lozoyensis (strain ATCC 20868 / MF5171) TaxID=1116229 RepID=S3CUG2_GLAL2|nr:uncharacterized protein GLAREA_09765 [Glarea lozoyensis ATCC 20868]EPE28644.1 hypothetical protein GLAREA_09765 [Glarea lozoyensis ATCC 20868]
MPQTPHLPPELLEHIIHFSIRAGSLKEALRLRLQGDFKTLVEQNMFRTRFLDDSVRALRAQGPAFGEPDLGFLKRYLAFCVNAGHEVTT